MLEFSAGVQTSPTTGLSLFFRAIKTACAWARPADTNHAAATEHSPLLIHLCSPELVMFSERRPEGEVLTF